MRFFLYCTTCLPLPFLSLAICHRELIEYNGIDTGNYVYTRYPLKERMALSKAWKDMSLKSEHLVDNNSLTHEIQQVKKTKVCVCVQGYHIRTCVKDVKRYVLLMRDKAEIIP